MLLRIQVHYSMNEVCYSVNKVYHPEDKVRYSEEDKYITHKTIHYSEEDIKNNLYYSSRADYPVNRTSIFYSDLNYEVWNTEITFSVLYTFSYHNLSSPIKQILPQKLDTQKYLQNVQKSGFPDPSGAQRISSAQNRVQLSGRQGCHTRKIFLCFCHV